MLGWFTDLFITKGVGGLYKRVGEQPLFSAKGAQLTILKLEVLRVSDAKLVWRIAIVEINHRDTKATKEKISTQPQD